MNKEIMDYLNILKFNSIIYDDDIYYKLEKEDECDKEYILSEDYLENIKTLLEDNEDTKHIDAKVISNILDTIQFIRVERGNTKALNEIVVRLNMAKDDNYLSFYRDSYLKRSGLFNKWRQESYSIESFNEDEILSELRYSIMQDHIITMCLLDDEDVDDLDDILVSDYFLNTLNLLMYECPEVFRVCDVKEKIKKVLNKIVKQSKIKNNENNLDTLSRYRSYILLRKVKKGK